MYLCSREMRCRTFLIPSQREVVMVSKMPVVVAAGPLDSTQTFDVQSVRNAPSLWYHVHIVNNLFWL